MARNTHWWMLVLAAVIGLLSFMWFASALASPPGILGDASDLDTAAVELTDHGSIMSGDDAAVSKGRLERSRGGMTSGTGRVRVRVRWFDDRPAAGIGVYALPLSLDEALWSDGGVTDSTGTWRSPPVPAGMCRVHLDRGITRETRIQDDEEAELRLRLPKGITLSVLILDPADQPVADAEVWLHPSMAPLTGRIPFLPTAVTDSAGRTKVPGIVLVPGSFCWLDACKPGYARSPRVGLTTSMDSDDRQRDVVLRLRPLGFSITGIVKGASGEGLSNALVIVTPTNSPAISYEDGTETLTVVQPDHGTRTSADGQFVLSLLDASSYFLRVRARGHHAYEETITLTPENPTAFRVVQLSEGGSVSGTVRDDGGLPVSEATVLIGSARAETDSMGRYSVESVKAGRALCSARSQYHETAHKEVDVPISADLTLDFELRKKVALRGRVVDEDGAPLSGWDVRLRKDWLESQDMHVAKTAADGTFSVSLSPDTDYELRLHEPMQWVPVVVADHESVRADPEPILLQVLDAQRATAFVAGRLVGPDGTPVTDLGVQVGDGEFLAVPGVSMPEVEWKKDSGEFVVGPLPPGRYNLHFQPWREDLPPFSVGDVHLVASRMTGLGNLSWPVGGFLELHATSAVGFQPIGVRVQIKHAASLDRIMELDNEGMLATALVPGTHDITVFGDNIATAQRAVHIGVDQTTRVQVELQAAATVRLRLHLPKGEVQAIAIVHDEHGQERLRYGLETPQPDVECHPKLTVGWHTLELLGHSGRRWHARFFVADLAPDRTVVDPELSEIR